jgi:DNA polymerase III sliding clamp (beta) subunit (PCNA family)
MNANILQAMAVLAAKKDTRIGLKGILVEQSNNTTRIVATDGNKMGIYNLPDQDNATSFSVIIPVEALIGLKGDVIIGATTLTTSDSVKTFTPIDARYPDYTRVVPRDKANGIASNFNVDYMAQFQKVARMLGKKDDSAVFYHNGVKNSAKVSVSSTRNFLGVVMPMRGDVVDDIDILTFTAAV